MLDRRTVLLLRAAVFFGVASAAAQAYVACPCLTKIERHPHRAFKLVMRFRNRVQNVERQILFGPAIPAARSQRQHKPNSRPCCTPARLGTHGAILERGWGGHFSQIFGFVFMEFGATIT